jgi:hypothetical protein
MGVADPDTRRGIARVLAAEACVRQVVFFTNHAVDAETVRATVKEPINVISIGKGNSVIPAIQECPTLPIYHFPPGPSEISLDLSLSAHHPRVVFTDSIDLAAIGDAPNITMALALLSPGRRVAIEPIVNAMDAIRDCIQKTMPTLKWEEIAEQKWVTPTFQEQMRADLNTCFGRAEEFLKRIEAYKSIREKTKMDARAFLVENAYIGVVPPSLESLRGTAIDHLGDIANAAYVTEWCLSRFIRFLPTT